MVASTLAHFPLLLHNLAQADMGFCFVWGPSWWCSGLTTDSEVISDRALGTYVVKLKPYVQQTQTGIACMQGEHSLTPLISSVLLGRIGTFLLRSQFLQK